MTKLVSTLILTTAAAFAVPAFAEPVQKSLAFERDGIHYVATVTERADGTRLIEGHETASGHAFALTVNRGMVNGTYDHQYITYPAPRAKAARPAPTASIAVANDTGM